MKEEIKAGIIILTSIVILSVFVILIGGSQFLEKYDTYTVRVMNAAGLETGAQVKLGGVRVGRVLNVVPPVKAGDSVTITVGIKRGTPVYKGTKAMISQVGFVGDIYLLLSVDDTVNEQIRVGDTIPSEEQVQMNVMMAKLKVLSQSVDILIKDIDKLFSEKNLQGIENFIGSTNKAILSGSSNLNEVATSMKATADKLALVLSDVEDLFRNNKGDVTQMIKQAKKDLEQAGEMIKSMESTAKAVEKTSRSADRIITLQSRNIENLIETMAKTTEDLQELLLEMKQKPWSLIYRERGK